MKLKKTEIVKIVNAIEKMNEASEKNPLGLPFKINYAIQRTLAKLAPEKKALDRVFDDIHRDILKKKGDIYKYFADRTKDEKGTEIPLVEKGLYVNTRRQSEQVVALDLIMEEGNAEIIKQNKTMEDEIEVEVFTFAITKEDEARLEKLDGVLYGLLPLIKE
jgi:hypothetical protein